MSQNYVLATRASRDLQQIIDYLLVNAGLTAASRVRAGLDEAFEKIAAMPGIGHCREDYTSTDVLFFTVWSYYIVYKPDSDPLEIVRIIHASRDISSALEEVT